MFWYVLAQYHSIITGQLLVLFGLMPKTFILQSRNLWQWSNKVYIFQTFHLFQFFCQLLQLFLTGVFILPVYKNKAKIYKSVWWKLLLLLLLLSFFFCIYQIKAQTPQQYYSATQVQVFLSLEKTKPQKVTDIGQLLQRKKRNRS